MLRRNNALVYWRTLTVFGVLVVFISACGGRGVSLPLSPSETDNTKPAACTNIEISRVLPPGSEHGLKSNIYHYTYDVSEFSEIEGVKAVPLSSKYEPMPEMANAYSVEVSQVGVEKKVQIDCASVSRPFLHLRYDQAVWDVASVGMPNPFPNIEKFVAFAHVPEDGVLEIAALPVGPDLSIFADGRLAEISLIPKGQRRAIDEAPMGENVFAACWFAQQQQSGETTVKGYGNINCDLDGEFGDSSSKDGNLEGAEISYEWDNATHDVELTDFGLVQGWDYVTHQSGNFQNMHLSWTERIQGDYDNDGEVSIGDIVPIAMLWYVAGDDKMAQSKLIEEGSGGTHRTLLEMINDRLWREDVHILESFYVFDISTVSGEGYTFDDYVSFGGNPPHGLNHSMNGVDGLFDGYVRDYMNWDTYPNDQIPDGYYTDLNLPGFVQGWTAPGDRLALYYHMGEQIDGSVAWTMPTELADNFNPEDDWDPSNPRGGSIKAVFVADREDWEDTPWTSQHALEQFRNPELWADLIATGNPETEGFDFSYYEQQGGSFDIIIAPYVEIDPGVYEYGVMTRLHNVLVRSPGDFGPQYNISDDVPTDMSTGRGLSTVGGYLDQFGVPQLQISFNKAQPIDIWHEWSSSYNPAAFYYMLYVSTDQETLFNSPMVTRQFAESDSTPDGEQLVWRSTFPAYENGIQFDDPELEVWYGIRVVDASGSVIEYEAPENGDFGTGIFEPNNSSVSYMIDDNPFGPQYKTNGLVYFEPPDDPHDPNRGVIQEGAENYAPDKYRFWFFDADQVANAEGVPVWDDEGHVNCVYRLYYKLSSDPIDLFSASYEEFDEQDARLTAETEFIWKIDLELQLTPNSMWEFGIRAFDPDSGVVEYNGTSDSPNVNTVSILVSNDFEGPIFVNPAEYSPEMLPATDFLINSYSFDGEVLLYFNPAIDPPDYNPNDIITYECYWSLSYFTANEIDGPRQDIRPLDDPISASYIDFYDISQYPNFNSEFLYYVIDNDGLPLSPGQAIWFYVMAVDMHGNRSKVFPTRSDAARRVDPTEILVLADGLGAGPPARQAVTLMGDIRARDGNVYVAYPSFMAPAINNSELLIDYRELHSGLSTPVDIDHNILAMSGLAQPAEMFNILQLSLDHRVTSQGSFVKDSNMELIPVLVYSGVQLDFLQGIINTTTQFAARDSTGIWSQHSYLDQPPPPNGSTYFSTSQVIQAFTFKSGGVLTSEYFLPWAFDISAVSSAAKLKYRTSTDLLNWQPITTMDAFDSFDQMGPGLNVRSTDLFQSQNWASLEGTALPIQWIYTLLSVEHYGFSYPGEKHAETMLYRSPDLDNWTGVDVDQGLSPLLAQDSEVWPNVMEVVLNPITDDRYLYVTYSSNDGVEVLDDEYGLRVALAVDSGGALTWSSPATAGLIDGTFAARWAWTHDAIDIRAKTDSTVTSYQFSGLGAAYVNDAGVLFLSETVGNGPNASWHKINGGPGSGAELDEGEIFWVKLVYFRDDNSNEIPYVLYARRTSALGGTDIVLWRQGGF